MLIVVTAKLDCGYGVTSERFTRRSASHVTLSATSARIFKKLFTLLDLCVSSLRRGHANLLCIVPILTDDPRRESEWRGLAKHGLPRPRRV